MRVPVLTMVGRSLEDLLLDRLIKIDEPER